MNIREILGRSDNRQSIKFLAVIWVQVSIQEFLSFSVTSHDESFVYILCAIYSLSDLCAVT